LALTPVTISAPARQLHDQQFRRYTFTAAGTAPLTGAGYTLNGSAARTGVTGTINGTFYGPMAAETGGNFTLQSSLGLPYRASGIFAGRR